MSLTDRQLNLISKQDTYDGKAEISDGEGLVVRITPQAKIYFHYRCRFNKKSLRIRIGKYPVTSLKEARRMHKLMMELRESGRNPNIAITDGLEFITLDDCVAYHNDVLFLGSDLDKPIIISVANCYIRRIRDGLPIEDWRTHDFRRSLSTGASELGVMPHVVEKMLGHELGGVLSVYNKHDWLKEQLEGYELYAEKLDSYLK